MNSTFQLKGKEQAWPGGAFCNPGTWEAEAGEL
jgi:hypothetical protein